MYSGEQERVWDGAEECEHKWGAKTFKRNRWGLDIDVSDKQLSNQGNAWEMPLGAFCQCCGAWRGAFGSEPSVALYIAHLMEFMAAIKRVLKDTGVCFINLADSYMGSGSPGGDFRDGKGGDDYLRPYGRNELPALNLSGVPQRFFLACQEQGWIVRSEIILAKDSTMPESVSSWRWERCRVKMAPAKIRYGARIAAEGTNLAPNGKPIGSTLAAQGDPDRQPHWANCPGCPRCIPNGGLVLRKGSWRPTSSFERLFMLTKGDGYFADGEDVREPHKPESLKRYEYGLHTLAPDDKMIAAGAKTGAFSSDRMGDFINPAGRNLRDVWPMKSSAFTMQLCKSCKRVYTGAQFGRLRGETKRCSCGASDWLSHFAAFHPSLPTTCILSSTSPKGNCSKCGMPWVRVIETVQHEASENYEGQAQKDYALAGAQNPSDTKRRILLAQARESQTLDWKPTCSCPDPTPEPALILDPFNGTASTGVAAKRLGRRYIGIDISEDYLRLSAARLQAETAGLI